MKKLPAVRKSRENQRGIALPYVGICLLAFLAFTVIAIDLGRQAHTATEAQNVADAAANAGAWAIHDGLDPTDGALAMAARYELNGTPADPARVEIDLGTYDDNDG